MSKATSAILPTLVLGSGPAALTAAIVLARRGIPVTLASAGAAEQAPRIDAVPLQTLAALVELGLHPAGLGVSQTSDHILTAWERAHPVLRPTAPRVHVERQLLDRALSALASRTPELTIEPEASPDDFEKVIDATGRRSRTALRVHRAAPVWIAQVRHFDGRFSPAQAALRTAALGNGYAYRLGTHERLSLGLVRPKDQCGSSEENWTDLLGRSGARWIIGGLDERAGTKARGGACSFQWTEPGTAQVIGDSAFAPDILASQGLSRAITAGLAVDNLAVGVGEAISTHCTKLRQVIAASRWASAPSWRAYDQSIASLAAEAAAFFGHSQAAIGAWNPGAARNARRGGTGRAPEWKARTIFL